MSRIRGTAELGWARVPPGTRESIYEVPEYKEAGGEFAALTKQIMSEVNPEQPGWYFHSLDGEHTCRGRARAEGERWPDRGGEARHASAARRSDGALDGRFLAVLVGDDRRQDLP